jgi:hypothetical protein
MRVLVETANCVWPTSDSVIRQSKRRRNNILNAGPEANMPQVCFAFLSRQHAAVPQDHGRLVHECFRMSARVDDMCECDESSGIDGAVIR